MKDEFWAIAILLRLSTFAFTIHFFSFISYP